MGLLTLGQPMCWWDSSRYNRQLKDGGVTQFLNNWQRTKKLVKPMLKWGDEVEYTLMTKRDEQYRLSLRAPEMITELQREESSHARGSASPETLWRPEYSRWQLEGTPGTPYRCYINDLTLVENNMAIRRRNIEALLEGDEIVETITIFPRLGCGSFTEPKSPVLGKFARSFYTSDEHIFPHPRFQTLTRNIRLRRGSKVSIHMPLFMDEMTADGVPVIPDESIVDESLPLEEGMMEDTAYDKVEDMRSVETDDVYMDSMAFGMGSNCLQITMQARDLDECRNLYDQLHVLSPIMLAATAASPVVRGLLLDTDARWDIISASVDDRTPEEISEGKITKSRYSSIDMYISARDELEPDVYNDLPVAVDEQSYQTLIDAGIDERMARHVAHLFVRDPLVVFEHDVEDLNPTSMELFEMIQSTNWNTVRFKPPPPQTDIGWRTEFRTMELQLTDFENAAYSVFVVLLSRVILAFDLNLYIPMSKCDENLRTAHERDAARDARFWFRRNIFSNNTAKQRFLPDFVCSCGHVHSPEFAWPYDFEGCDENDTWKLYTLNEIFNGTPLASDGVTPGFAFPGLIPLVRTYLRAIHKHDSDANTMQKLNTYLDFVAARARGSLCTTARWMRDFLERHPQYRKDSKISEQVCSDLIRECRRVSRGEVIAAKLLGDFYPSNRAEFVEGSALESLRQKAKEEGEQLRGASLSMSVKNRAFHAMAQNAP